MKRSGLWPPLDSKQICPSIQTRGDPCKEQSLELCGQHSQWVSTFQRGGQSHWEQTPSSRNYICLLVQPGLIFFLGLVKNRINRAQFGLGYEEKGDTPRQEPHCLILPIKTQEEKLDCSSLIGPPVYCPTVRQPSLLS